VNKEILGLESALDEAKSKPMQSMVISCNLVAELAEEIKSLRGDNERLIKELNMFTPSPSNFYKNQAERDLKQQAKGIIEAVSKSITPSIANWPDDEYLTGFMDCTNGMLSIAANLTKQTSKE